jgi:Ca-activated chloride channel family protein
MNQMVRGETKVGVDAVTDTALTYQLLSQYTAFVAVSDEVRVNPNEHSVSVQVPVEMPEGMSYEGIFGSVVQKSASNVYSERMMPPTSAPVDAFDITLIDPGMIVDEEELWQDFAEPASAAPSKASTPPVVPSYSPPPLSPSLPRQTHRHRSQEFSHRLQIVSAFGLDENAIALLTQHLQLIELPPGVVGDLVFEFHVSNRHVRQVVLDEQASSIHDEIVIEAIRRSLLVWRPPQSAIDSVRLLVSISP